MQMSFFSGWIDGLQQPPEDGQKVIAYTLIENPEDDMPMFKKLHIKHNGITISGPVVMTFEKEFVDSGAHRPIAYWQPVDPLN